jgi:hypothetical protein
VCSLTGGLELRASALVARLNQPPAARLSQPPAARLNQPPDACLKERLSRLLMALRSGSASLLLRASTSLSQPPAARLKERLSQPPAARLKERLSSLLLRASRSGSVASCCAPLASPAPHQPRAAGFARRPRGERFPATAGRRWGRRPTVRQ